MLGSGIPGEWEGIGAQLPVVRRAELLQHFLDALGSINDVWLKEHPETPLLYSSGVTYQHEDSKDEWRDIPSVLDAGSSDCEDLASWRAAELRAHGVSAETLLKWQQFPEGGTLYHVVVFRRNVSRDLPPGWDKPGQRVLYRYEDGWIEDPSRVLGMP